MNQLSYLLLFSFYFFNLEIVNCISHCGGLIDSDISFIDAYEGNKRLLQSEWGFIRIHIDLEDLNFRNISNKIKEGIKESLNKASMMFKSLINVIPLKKKLALTKCGNLTVSSSIKEGVDADFILFASFNKETPPGIEASAGICGQDSISGRPLAGYVTFTNYFNVTKVNWLEYNTYLAFHEITHLLVFNINLFSFFKDTKGKPIPIQDILTNKTVNNLTRVKLKTPKVLEYAKRHFNCNEIEGIELENQGGKGTMLNHWEARLMLSDYMVGISYDENTISEMTLALFEDSGWYKVNYYTGGLFRWGKGEGCGFLNNSCIINEKSVFPNEYCNKNTVPTCSNGRVAKGICSIQKVKEPTEKNNSYNYFSDMQGRIAEVDFCPVSISPIVRDYYLGLNCAFGVYSYSSKLGESISNRSACFISSLVNNKNKAICYEYNCDYKKRSLSVYIGNYSTECPLNGGVAYIEGMLGVLYCPDFNSICTKTSECVSMVDCALNKVIANQDSFIYNYTRKSIDPTGESILLNSYSQMIVNNISYIFILQMIIILLI